MKKAIVIFMLIVAVMNMSACQRSSAAMLEESTLETTAAVPTEAAAPETIVSTADREAMLKAYQFALQQISFEHIYPDGTDIGFDGTTGFIEDNRFAIFDVDGDGMEELIVSITTAPMAGQMETIYGYDPDSEELQMKLQAFPALTYYTNGIIRANWSHNHTLSMSQWPYNLYAYDALTGIYTSNTSVYAWDKAIAETDEAGNPYPQDVDRDNAGTVFYITQNRRGNWVSKADYESWLESVMGKAEEMDIPYQPMTEENIKKVAG